MKDFFKQLTQKITVNGVEIEAKIDISVSEDDINPRDDFDFGSEEENELYLERFTSGQLFIAIISVEATAVGETGMDVLGGCHVHCNNYFDSSKYDKDINGTVESHAMIENALSELNKSICARADQLKPFILK